MRAANSMAADSSSPIAAALVPGSRRGVAHARSTVDLAPLAFISDAARAVLLSVFF